MDVEKTMSPLSTIVNLSPFASYTTDLSGTILFANENLASLLQKPLTSLITKSRDNFFAPHPTAQIVVDHIQLNGSEVFIESPKETTNALRFFQTYRSRVEFEQTEPGYLYQLIDVTAHEQFRREIVRFFELSIDLICVVGQDGVFKRASRSFEETLGYSLEELQTRPFIEFVHPDDRETTIQEFQSILGGRPTIQFENRYICKDGSIKWIGWNCPAIDPETGYVYAVARNVTSQRLAKEEINKTSHYYDLIIENAPIMLFIKDSSYKVQLWNKMAEQISGIPREEILGKTGFESFPEEDMHKYLENDQTVLEKRESVLVEEPILTRSRGTRLLRTKKIPVLNAEGDPLFLIGLSEDITEAKKKETELKQFAKTVAEKNSYIEKQAHSLKLQAEDLANAKNLAEKALEVKNEFVANMSHEIRTPMNAIIGMSNLAWESATDPSQKEYLETLKLSAESLLTIINDILDVSKIESGKFSIEHARFDLEAHLKHTWLLLSPTAAEKHLSFTYTLEKNVPQYVITDPTRLRQVLLNLLSNAIKFTPTKGTVSLNVTCHPQKSSWASCEQLTLHFLIKDSGIGISSENLKMIFDAFSQADASTTRKYGGTGLGLTISKKIVEIMGGHISVESKLGEGSVFRFSIPAVISETIVSVNKHSVEKPFAPSSKVENVILKILVAEDNAVNQNLMKKLLEKEGCQVVIASNGAEALKLFSSSLTLEHGQGFDFIFMDCQMPVLSGYEAVRAIRSLPDERAKSISIIAMTANALEGEKEKCLACGMNDYVTKPIDIEMLRSFISLCKKAKYEN